MQRCLCCVLFVFAFGLVSGQTTARIVKVERTLCAGSVLGRNRDGSAYAWNCRGLPMIRLTLDDGSILGPMIGVTVDTVGDPLVWQTIPVDVLKTGTTQPRATAAHARDPFMSGPPFSIEQIVERVGIIPGRRLGAAIASRGISFAATENEFDRLRRAGAEPEVIQAVAEATRLSGQ